MPYEITENDVNNLAEKIELDSINHIYRCAARIYGWNNYPLRIAEDSSAYPKRTLFFLHCDPSDAVHEARQISLDAFKKAKDFYISEKKYILSHYTEKLDIYLINNRQLKEMAGDSVVVSFLDALINRLQKYSEYDLPAEVERHLHECYLSESRMQVEFFRLSQDRFVHQDEIKHFIDFCEEYTNKKYALQLLWELMPNVIMELSKFINKLRREIVGEDNT